LLAALPSGDRAAFQSVLLALRLRGRWAQAAEVGRVALEAHPNDVTLLRMLIEADTRTQQTADLAAQARRLTSLDSSRGAMLTAADALRTAGELDEAEQLLMLALTRERSDTTGLAVELGRVEIERGETERAREVLSDALGRAVTPQEKAAIHAALADVADHEGRTSRASVERAEAARLQR
jgi:hypothetical protein